MMSDSLAPSENILPAGHAEFVLSRSKCLAEHYIKTPLLDHQNHAVQFMLLREKASFYGVRGGINAQAMGLGKTLEMLTLLALDKVTYCDVRCMSPAIQPILNERYARELAEIGTKSALPPRATLVITHETGIRAWKECLQKHTHPGALKWIDISSGNSNSSHAATAVPKKTLSKVPSQEELDCSYDIIFISFNQLKSSFATFAADQNGDKLKAERRTSGGGKVALTSDIYKRKFRRLIIDEAHRAKNPQTKLFRALLAIQAQRRWAMSGTILINSQSDIGSVLMLIGMKHPVLQHWEQREFSLKEAVMAQIGLDLPFCTSCFLFVALVRTKATPDAHRFIQEKDPLSLIVWSLAAPLHAKLPLAEYARTPERLWEMVECLQQDFEGDSTVTNGKQASTAPSISLLKLYTALIRNGFPQYSSGAHNIFRLMLRQELGLNMSAINTSVTQDATKPHNAFVELRAPPQPLLWTHRIWFRLLLYGSVLHTSELDVSFLRTNPRNNASTLSAANPSYYMQCEDPAFPVNFETSSKFTALRMETLENIRVYISNLELVDSEVRGMLYSLKACQLRRQEQSQTKPAYIAPSSSSSSSSSNTDGHLLFARPSINATEQSILDCFHRRIIKEYASVASTPRRTIASLGFGTELETDDEYDNISDVIDDAPDRATSSTAKRAENRPGKSSTLPWFTFTRSALCHVDAVVLNSFNERIEDCLQEAGNQRALDYYRSLEEEILTKKPKTMARVDYIERTAHKRCVSTKMRMLKEYLQTSVIWKRGEKLIVWSNFHSALKMFYWYAKSELGYECAFLSGKTKDEGERSKIIARAKDPNDPLQVIFLTANYCESLNLYIFNHSIFIDQFYHLGRVHQAGARIDRIEQMRYTYRSLFVVDDSFDVVLYGICAAKMSLEANTTGADITKDTHMVDRDSSTAVSALRLFARNGRRFVPIDTGISIFNTREYTTSKRTELLRQSANMNRNNLKRARRHAIYLYLNAPPRWEMTEVDDTSSGTNSTGIQPGELTWSIASVDEVFIKERFEADVETELLGLAIANFAQRFQH